MLRILRKTGINAVRHEHDIGRRLKRITESNGQPQVVVQAPKGNVIKFVSEEPMLVRPFIP